MPNEVRQFIVNIDVTELRDIYSKYGFLAVEGALESTYKALKAKVAKALNLRDVDEGKKTLVEG